MARMRLADNPGRHEPGSGEINYAFLFAFLDRIGYKGRIGCAYVPAAATEAGLGCGRFEALSDNNSRGTI